MSATAARGICTGGAWPGAPGEAIDAPIPPPAIRRACAGPRGGHPSGGDEDVLERLDIVAVVAGVADADRVALAALDGHRQRPAPHRHLDHVLDVADVDAVAGRLLAVDLDLDVALADDLVGEDVGRTADPAQHRGDLLADALDVVELGAEDLHGDRQPHAGREHLDPGGDRLGEAVAPAGHLQGRAHLLDQVGLRLLPEQEPVGERLVERGAEGRQLLRSRVARDELAVAAQLRQLVEGRPVGGADGAVEQLPVERLDPFLEPVLMAGVEMLGDPGEQGRLGKAQHVAGGRGGPLEECRGRREQVGAIAEHSQLHEPLRRRH